MRYRIVLIVLGAAASLAACEAETSSAPSMTAPSEMSTLVIPTCTARNIGAIYGLTVQGPDAPEPTAIPSDFMPTSVITCEPDWAGGTAEGMAAWVETHRRGNLEVVLRAYAEPSEPRDPTCLVDQAMPPTVWLVSDEGNGMRPVLPQTECGAYKHDAITAIQQLPVTDKIVRQVAFLP